MKKTHLNPCLLFSNYQFTNLIHLFPFCNQRKKIRLINHSWTFLEFCFQCETLIKTRVFINNYLKSLTIIGQCFPTKVPKYRLPRKLLLILSHQ